MQDWCLLYPPKVDIGSAIWNVRFGPIATTQPYQCKAARADLKIESRPIELALETKPYRVGRASPTLPDPGTVKLLMLKDGAATGPSFG